jgi:hypothetical protein
MGSSPIKSDSKSTSMDLEPKQFRYGDGLTVVNKPQRTTTALFLPRAGTTQRSRTTSDSRRRLRKLILMIISYSSFRTRLLWRTLRPLKAGPTIARLLATEMCRIMELTSPTMHLASITYTVRATQPFNDLIRYHLKC